MIGAALTGFFTAFSLILAIGAQNAFVLRQGLLRQHVFWLCLLCALSDAVLVSLGVAGFGWLVVLSPNLPFFMTLAGAGFLVVYGALKFISAFRGTSQSGSDTQTTGLRATLLTGLALTWLNPHVYLDTLGLIGAVSAQFSGGAQKTVFALAAISASFVFFFSLGYGATFLSPLFATKRAWKLLDMGIGATMWTIAATLLLSL